MIKLPPTPVAIVDDEEDVRSSINQWLELSGFIPTPHANAEEALDAINADFPGVVLTDVRMPRMDGMELLQRLVSLDKDLPVILLTGHGDVPMAVEAMRLGAYDFIEKPFNPDRLTDLVRRAAEARRLVLENRLLRRERVDGEGLLRNLVGDSAAMKRLREDIVDLAATDANILVQGETGTGKNLIARALHACSRNAAASFVELNCATLPGENAEVLLLELLQKASGGTIFLDEVTALPTILQPRLIDALERFTAHEAPRLLSSSLESAEAAMECGQLRKDLYFRLAAMEITAPPLRDRGEDILMLFDQFCLSSAAEHNCPAPAITADDAATLLQFPWPGNVRQLQNLAERTVLRSKRGPVVLQELLEPVGNAGAQLESQEAQPLKDHVEAFERMLIRNALRRHRGHISQVMDELALPRRTLNEKMARYGISRSDFV